MDISDFFTLSDRRIAKKYSICNSNGFTVTLTDMGGSVTEILTPDKNGVLQDVVLGYNNPELYESNPAFFGALVGRVANRIKGGSFTIDGIRYQVPVSDSGNRPNALHGGLSWARRLWRGKALNEQQVKFTISSPDGDAGFPGNVEAQAIYTVGHDNTLTIDYRAVSDKKTIINLTNHTYFNLNGINVPDCRGHIFMIAAGHRTPVDGNLIPDGTLCPLDSTVYDLRTGRSFEDIITEIPDGFDDNFVLSMTKHGFLQNAAEVYSQLSGIRMRVSTSEPGLQFYMSGGLHNEKIAGKSGRLYGKFGGFCMEAQLWPDSVNHETFPSAILLPGCEYSQKTVYRFSAGRCG